MKKHKKLLLILLGITLTLITCTIFVASGMTPIPSFMQRNLESNQNRSDAELEQELVETYRRMSAIELLDELNMIYQTTGNPAAAIYAASVFAEKAGTITDDDLYSIIQSEHYSVLTKNVAIQSSEKINNGEGVQNQSQFWELIADPNTNSEIRKNLINSITVRNDRDIQVLVDLALDENGDSVFHSMESLKHVDFGRALEISNVVLENFKRYNTELVRGAVYVKSMHFRELCENVNHSNEKFAFIDLCLEIFEYYGGHLGNYNEHFLVADAMIFALIEMMDFDAVRAIISSSIVEDELKFYCIDQNFPAIAEAIKEGLSSEEIDILLDAMEFIPIIEICELLIEKDMVKTVEQQTRMKQLLERAYAAGTHALPHFGGKPPVEIPPSEIPDNNINIEPSPS